MEIKKSFIFDFFENIKLTTIKSTKESNDLLYSLYIDIFKEYQKLVFEMKNKDFVKIEKIKSSNDIPFPKNKNILSSQFFPEKIVNFIFKNMKTYINYNFKVESSGKKISFHFLTQEEESILNIEVYNYYAILMMSWILLLNSKIKTKCSKILNVYIYLTPYTKKLPEKNNNNNEYSFNSLSSQHTHQKKKSVISSEHVNTAFTTSCPEDGYIIIYRFEEFFKVFIHETFHSFGLDFSNMNNSVCHSNILSLFGITSEVNLYEAYTEFWAEIINVVYFLVVEKELENNKKEVIYFINKYINIEIRNSMFQVVKILDFMSLDYKSLISNHPTLKEKYNEKTNVLSYFIIKLVFLYNYPQFLSICKNKLSENNIYFCFKNDNDSTHNLFLFIKKYYNNPSFIGQLEKMKYFLDEIKTIDDSIISYEEKNNLLTNLRMTVIDIFYSSS